MITITNILECSACLDRVDAVVFDLDDTLLREDLTISDYIKNLHDETLKSSLKFNIAQIVESIKLLLIMRSDSEMFDKNNLTFEQKEVLKIYNYVCSTDLGKLFEKYDTFKKDDIKKVKKPLSSIEDNNSTTKKAVDVNKKPVKTVVKGGNDSLAGAGGGHH